MQNSDERLAEWAELLRVRGGLATGGETHFVVRYGSNNSLSEYEANWSDTGLLEDFLGVFWKDATYRIEKLEAELKAIGIAVKRPEQLHPMVLG